MANIFISDISFMTVAPSATPSVQTTPPSATGTTTRIRGIVSSIRPLEGSSSAGKAIPVPSQVSASSSSTKEEEKDFIRLFSQTLRIASGKTIYEGQLKNGKFHGNGKLTCSNGTIYEGQFKDGKFLNGKVTTPEGVYEGQLKDGKFHGNGKYSFSDGKVYIGQFQDGKYHNQGIYITNRKVYVGQFKDGKFHGNGKLTYSNGTVHKGQFENNEFIIQNCCIQ